MTEDKVIPPCPDLSKKRRHVLNDKTIIYFSKNLSLKEIKERIKLYEKNAEKATNTVTIFRNE
jgi:hypothetical protein